MSIPGMAAKAIIDMLAVVQNVDDVAAIDRDLALLGWVAAPEPGDEHRRVRAFGTPSVARRTHHLHVVEAAEDEWRGTLAFRDHLRHRGRGYGLRRAQATLIAGSECTRGDDVDRPSRGRVRCTRGVELWHAEPSIGTLTTPGGPDRGRSDPAASSRPCRRLPRGEGEDRPVTARAMGATDNNSTRGGNAALEAPRAR